MRLLLVFASVSFGLSTASAQNFREAAARAEEISDLTTFARPLFIDCRGQAASCERRRRGQLRQLRRRTWLASLPAVGNVEIGPYETVREGFLVRVPDLMFEAGGGLLTTQAPQEGAVSRYVVSERFFVVPPERAERWFRRNSVERMRLRVVFRVGRPWTSGDKRGAVIRASGIQIYNASTGNVLIDTIANPPPPPGGPVDLYERVTLWDPSQVQEARWRSPDGTPLLLSVRIDPSEAGRVPVLVETRGVTRRDVAQFPSPRANSSLAVIPRGADGILVVFTLERPGEGGAGQGVVKLYRWQEGTLREAAAWSGSNDDSPPAWIVDEDAPLPELP
ncbi:MAG: hypothetical protein AAGE52_03470 [Myxococcota bacterium]